MKPRKKHSAFYAVFLAVLMVVSLLLGGCRPGETGAASSEPQTVPQTTLTRSPLLDFGSPEPLEAEVPAYQVQPDLSDLVNLEQFYLSDRQKELLAENQFVVTTGYYNEFFEIYEYNRYLQVPNFVTVDSLMHTYHLYFSLLLNRTEKEFLAADLQRLSAAMLDKARQQYEALEGTSWEEAARRTLAFFAVGAKLQDESLVLPEAAEELAQAELDRVLAAESIGLSGITEDYLDYTQFRPRGYYAGNPVLEDYFRAMMWYGQVNFAQEKDTLSRAALLVNLALDQAAEDWENIYTVTAFFAGASDDLGYYEYAPAIREAYGGMPAAAELPDREEEYQSFKALVEKLDPPAINSVPVWDDPQDTADAQEVLESKKGFRFMGQRFSIDAAVFQQLVYRAVDPAPGDQKRLLPDFLDLPAALGSDTALELLEQQGVAEYPNYLEQMEKLRASVEQAPASSWGASLSSGWLYTLLPVLEPKGEGWPSYRTSVQWQKKNLETFAGSYTELKHDTVLYAKQVMGEMGGGMIEEVDDRGYVDPEAEVYRRFALLAQQTSEGLDRLGYLEEADRENLSRLAELARQLETISEKELKNQTLTEEEYELIRGYGGSLEHFWLEAVKDRVGEEYFTAQEIPSSLVTDIATDPNGLVLQLANARPSELLVVVPVDGTLRLACGAVYDFYQFVQPMEQRLTDEEWREQIGQWAGPYGRNPDAQVEKPWWTLSYWSAE